MLRDLYVHGKYRDVILPMTVLRCLDAVFDMKISLDKRRIVHQDQALRQAAKQSFYNVSKFTLRDLKNRASQFLYIARSLLRVNPRTPDTASTIGGMRSKGRPYYVYLLECRGGRLYTGITTDLARRLKEHRGGARGAKFTRAHPPAKLLAARRVPGRSAALRLEAALKKLRRARKLAWAVAQGFQ